MIMSVLPARKRIKDKCNSTCRYVIATTVRLSTMSKNDIKEGMGLRIVFSYCLRMTNSLQWANFVNDKFPVTGHTVHYFPIHFALLFLTWS